MTDTAPPPAASKGADIQEQTAPSLSPSPSGEPPAKPEHGGPKGLEPTRYGDWERNGRCFDF